MSKFTDWWTRNNGDIKQSDFDKFFSVYKNSSPLASVLTPEQTNAVSNFNANRRSPGMAEDVIPGIDPTDLSATQKTVLEPVPWMVPMAGEGPRFQQTPASMQTWMKKQAEEEIKMAKEQKAIVALMLSNPEYFVGVTAGSFTNKKQADDFLKMQKEFELKGGRLGETKTHNRIMERISKDKAGLGGFGTNVSTGTVAGGGGAPVSGEKIRMRAPDGVIGLVNPADVLRLKSKGYSAI